jgi:hypothetical protein
VPQHSDPISQALRRMVCIALRHRSSLVTEQTLDCVEIDPSLSLFGLHNLEMLMNVDVEAHE